MTTLSVRQEALSHVQNALPVFQRINDLYLQAENLHQQVMIKKAQAANAGHAKGKILGIGGGLAIAWVTCLFVGLFAKIPVLGSIVLLDVGLLIAGLACAYFIYKSMPTRQENIAAMKAEEEAQVALAPQMEYLSQEVYRLFNENRDVILPIPRDYRSYDAVVFFESALANGRADSMKEALNLYEEHLHRAALEMNSQLTLEQSRRQSAMLASIEDSARQTAINSGIAAGFSVLNYLSHH